MNTSWSVGPNRFERAVVTLDAWQVELGLGWDDLYDADSRKDVALAEWPSSDLRREAATRFDAATMAVIDQAVEAAPTEPRFVAERARHEQLASAWRRLPLLAREPIEPGVVVEYGDSYTSGALRVTLGEPPKPGLARPHVVQLAAGPEVMVGLHCFVEGAGGWLLCSASTVRFVDRALQAVTVDLTAYGVERGHAGLLKVVECGRRGPHTLARLHSSAHPRGALAQVLREAWWLVFDGAQVVGRSL